MAEEKRLVPFVTAPVVAALDLRAHQYKAVRFDAGGVRLATSDAGSGRCYILMNAPNSGQHVSLNVAPNVTKAVAGSTIVAGQLVLAGQSATCLATSYTIFADSAQVLVLGDAVTGCVSGAIFSLQLR